MPTARDWIALLDLKPHPEGGYYLETYRAAMLIDTATPAHAGSSASRSRNISTAIYFLLEGDQVSALHRIKSDEVWHFYAGSSLAVHGIHPDGSTETWRLGTDTAAGDRPQCVVPAGTWFGAHLVAPAGYALVGCTVAPGFDFADFEMADRTAMLTKFPEASGTIERLTR